mmetsp:Transcript_61412/g.179495  ORF Transcript_61412/g.179495 Transcript_61412/m.179495 type:complete len:209 (-) Transcript_61412:46-672(-)
MSAVLASMKVAVATTWPLDLETVGDCSRVPNLLRRFLILVRNCVSSQDTQEAGKLDMRILLEARSFSIDWKRSADDCALGAGDASWATGCCSCFGAQGCLGCWSSCRCDASCSWNGLRRRGARRPLPSTGAEAELLLPVATHRGSSWLGAAGLGRIAGTDHGMPTIPGNEPAAHAKRVSTARRRQTVGRKINHDRASYSLIYMSTMAG